MIPFFSSRFGFVEFATADLAQAATQIATEIDGRTPEFRIATASPARPDRPARDSSPREPRDLSAGPRNPANPTVWVGNVAWAVEESEIQEAFEQYGEVLRVSLPRDRETGRSRGIAYVEFAQLSSAETAVSEAAIELEGRALRLDFASSPSGPTTGGRGGFGGGRGGGGRDGGRGGGRGGKLTFI